MFYQKNKEMGFADGYAERCIWKNTFFSQINMLIGWGSVEKEIAKVYKRGHSADGRLTYRRVLLFMILLIGKWYDLSNEKIEDSVNDSLSMMRFCDLDIEDGVPDPGVDGESRYLKNGKKIHFRYKRHILTGENGIQLSVHATTANEYDSKGMKSCLKNQDKDLGITFCYTDKDCQLPGNTALLRSSEKNPQSK